MESYFLLVFVTVYVAAGGKVTVTKFEPCDSKQDYPINVDMKFKDTNEMQMIEVGSYKSKVPLEKDSLETLTVYVADENDNYELIVTLIKPFCELIEFYLGDFGQGIQKEAGIKPGTCELPAGADYRLKNYALDFNKSKYQEVPAGKYRLKSILKNNHTDTVLSCLDIEFTII